MAGYWAVEMVLTRVDSRAERMVMIGVGPRAGNMAASWFDLTVDWMTGCWVGRMILPRGKCEDK